MNSTKQVIMGNGVSDPVVMGRSLISDFHPIAVQPITAMIILSDDAQLTWVMESTGEDPKTIDDAAWIYEGQTINSCPTDIGSSLLKVLHPVTALRLRVYNWRSGSATFYVVQ